MAKIQCLSCGGMTDIGNAASGECLYCGCRVSLRRISAFSPVSRTELPQLKAAAEKESGENPDAELALALCYLKSGNFALAKKRLAALIETCPEYAEVYYYYVLAMFNGRNPGELTMREAREFSGHLQTAIMLDEDFIFPKLLFALICIEYYEANDLLAPADGQNILNELAGTEIDQDEFEFFTSAVNTALL